MHYWLLLEKILQKMKEKEKHGERLQNEEISKKISNTMFNNPQTKIHKQMNFTHKLQQNLLPWWFCESNKTRYENMDAWWIANEFDKTLGLKGYFSYFSGRRSGTSQFVSKQTAR